MGISESLIINNNTLITVVIPTINRKSFLESTLTDLSLQEHSNFDIVIVDQSDDEFNYKIPESLKSRVTILQLVEKSASKARNLGLLHSKGKIVLFLDDDIIIDKPDFLYNHARHYSNPEINGVAGAILNTSKTFTSKRHKWSFKKRVGWLFFPINFNRSTFIESAWAGNFSIRKELALSIGGMDENFSRGAFREEADFCYRFCEKFGPFFFDPNAYIIHIGAPSGGIRTFAVPVKVKAQQHYDGQFYFLLKNVPYRDYIYHFVTGYIYFLHGKIKWYNLKGIYHEFVKCFRGLNNARRLLKAGPKYISSKKQ